MTTNNWQWLQFNFLLLSKSAIARIILKIDPFGVFESPEFLSRSDYQIGGNKKRSNVEETWLPVDCPDSFLANRRSCVRVHWPQCAQTLADESRWVENAEDTHAGWPWRSPLQWRPRAAPFASSSFLSHHRRAHAAFFPFRSSLFSFFDSSASARGFQTLRLLCNSSGDDASISEKTLLLWRLPVPPASQIMQIGPGGLRLSICRRRRLLLRGRWGKLNFKLPQSEIDSLCGKLAIVCVHNLLLLLRTAWSVYKNV